MKVLISGGLGFMGSALASYLSKKNIHVEVLDFASGGSKHTPDLRAIDLKCIYCDLTQPINTDSFDSDYTHIIHLAAILGVENVIKRPFQVLDANFQMTSNITKLAMRQRDLKQLMYASTSEVYAGYAEQKGAKFPTPEGVPIVLPKLSAPRTSYMLSKLYGEGLISQSGLPFTIIRPHNIYGPNMGMRHVIPQLIQKVLANNNANLDVFSPSHTRTFLFISDAVEYIWRLLSDSCSIGKTINLGNDKPEITMRELAELIIELLGSSKKIEEKENAPGSPERRAPEISLLRQITGYESQISLKAGVKRTIEYTRFL